MYSYYYYYDLLTAMPIAVLTAAILAIVMYFTFLRKENEGKYTGWKKTVYDFFNFNRFYTEDIMKLLYVLLTAAFTVIGIFMLFVEFATGLILIIVGNLALRIAYELVMMFVILCRKTVSIDKKMDRVVAFYGDDFDEGECEGECGSCDADCGMRDDEETASEEAVDGDSEKSYDFSCSGNCSGCGVEGCGSFSEEEAEDNSEEN